MSLSATLLNEYQKMYVQNELDKYNELSGAKPFGFWEAFRRDTPNTLPGLEQALDAFGQPQRKGVKIPVIGANAGVVSNAHPGCDIVATESTSAEIALTYTPVTYSFKVPTLAELSKLNEVSAVAILAKELRETFGKMRVELNTRGYTAMNNARTQVFADPIKSTFNAVDDILEFASGADSDFFINYLIHAMVEAGYGTDYNFIANGSMQAQLSKIAGQGATNATNLAFQLGLASFNNYTSQITNAVTDWATGFIAPTGSLASFTALHRNSVEMTSITEEDEWGIIPSTPLGVPVGYHRKRSCTSGATGAEYYDSWELTVYASFVTSWVLDPATQQHPITKLALKA